MFVGNLNRRIKIRFYLLKPILNLTSCLKSLVSLVNYYLKASLLKHLKKLILTSLLFLIKTTFLTYSKNK